MPAEQRLEWTARAISPRKPGGPWAALGISGLTGRLGDTCRAGAFLQGQELGPGGQFREGAQGACWSGGGPGLCTSTWPERGKGHETGSCPGLAASAEPDQRVSARPSRLTQGMVPAWWDHPSPGFPARGPCCLSRLPASPPPG